MQLIDYSDLTENKIIEFAEILKNGGLGSWKTDTLYGYFCRFDAIGSISRILDLKGRSVHHKLSIAFDSFNKFSSWFYLDKRQEAILSATLPGPFTYILKLRNRLQDTWFKNEDFLGIRVPAHQLTLDICQTVGIPLVATSANISSRKDASSIEEIPGCKEGKLEFIIDSGKISKPIASTVVKFTNDNYSILREGAISAEEFQAIWNKSI